MRKRLILLLAAAMLVLFGAAPVYAAPGGVPGPPADHGNHGHNAVTDETDDTGDTVAPGDTTSHVPDWAKAYGRRIIDEYGMPYGHLQQCAGVTVAPGDEASNADEATDEAPRGTLDACPTDLQFPEVGQGAKAFWLFTELGKLILGL